ncbi:UNVERIFIED_CONTAM: hypothetical protein Sangu_1704100 [Sesamum angustifolium]|uniref:Uncharacterized protein n=1 Tax=Sesamum angustifolium TaxID=2727405 RepID=A0AAW2MN59_9LAMI
METFSSTWKAISPFNSHVMLAERETRWNGTCNEFMLCCSRYGKSDSPFSLEMDARKASVEDEEYIRIFSRIDELEKEEEEAENGNESDEDEQIRNEPDSTITEMSIHQEVRSSPVQVIDAAKAPEAPAVSKRDGSSHRDYPPLNSSTMNKVLELPEEKNIQASPTTSNMAFTGSIVEHAPNIGMNMPEQQTGARSSKPVSRFKMQRK